MRAFNINVMRIPGNSPPRRSSQALNTTVDGGNLAPVRGPKVL